MQNYSQAVILLNNSRVPWSRPPFKTYGTMYGMKRTTIYLPEEMKSRLEHEASRRQITEAELIRRAVDNELHRRAPRGGIISGAPKDGITGANLHEHMEGFGEQ
jgi:hypothetical protein